VNIGIIGAGSIGGTLARRLAALGHQVSVANSRGPDTLAELAAESGVRPVRLGDAGQDNEILIIAVPEKSVRELPGSIFDHLPDDATVVDAGNYIPRQRDGNIPEIEAGLSESQWVQNQLGRPVVKAFNTIGAHSMATGGRRAGTPDRVAAPVAGDDPGAKAKVIGLIDELGFDGFSAGSLEDSWRQQPGTPVFTADLPLDRAREALAAAHPERPPAFVATTR
jgi:8-hydroxy-5-deazaflavin:NADPH oxidoreductase